MHCLVAQMSENSASGYVDIKKLWLKGGKPLKIEPVVKAELPNQSAAPSTSVTEAPDTASAARSLTSSSATAEGAGEGSDASSRRAGAPPSRDKTRINALNYSMRSAPEELKARYAELQSLRDKAALNDFITGVINMKGKCDDDALRRKRNAETSDSQLGVDKWITWKEAIAKHFDEDVLKELDESGEVAARKMGKLAKSSKIPWPRS